MKTKKGLDLVNGESFSLCLDLMMDMRERKKMNLRGKEVKIKIVWTNEK